MTLSSSVGQSLVGVQANDQVEAAEIPVDLSTNTPRYLLRVTTPVLCAGDLLDVDAWARVTNDCGYTIGVGWYVRAYLYGTPPWAGGPAAWNVSPLNGDNVDVVRHHMPLHTSCLYQVPQEYDGERLVVGLLADAHSTAWQAGDVLTVDAGYGQLIVRHWTV